METIGDRVRRRRAELRRMSQTKLAAAVGVSQQAIASLEGNRTASFREIGALAEALGVSVKWLTTGAGEKLAAASPEAADAAAARAEFAQRVREARLALSLSVDQAARRIMTPADWRLLEDGELWPGPLELDLICGRLMQSLDWLVRGVVIAHAERPAQSVERVVLHEVPPPLRGPRKP